MIKVLITGKNSYVGNSLKDHLKKYPDKYSVNCISVRNEKWKETDFSQYKTIFHVAGIAHVPYNSKNDQIYYDINEKLTLDIAKKAKRDGVSQFIFMSSMAVYGSQKESNGRIDEHSVPKPENAYGQSKLNAELGLNELNDESFRVAIIRPPMIYGKESKGNYAKLSKLAKITPVFPDFKNERSMI